MQHKNKWIGIMVRCVLTMFLTLALCIDMEIPSVLDSQTVGIAKRFWHIIGLETNTRLVTPLFFLLLWANWKIDEKKNEHRIAFPIVSGFIAMIWLMGEGFRVDNTLWTLHASYMQIVKSIIYYVGITYGLSQITYLLYSALEKLETENLESTLAVAAQGTWYSHFVKAYQKHTVLVSFGVILTLWLPHLILAYPANVCHDAYAQLGQFFGFYNYSNHHPVTSTLIMGGLVKVGSLISGNFGFFLYITVQTIIGAWIMAYTLFLMRELHTPIWLRLLSFCCYIFVPYYTDYISVMLKDVLYSYAALLFVIELIYLLMLNDDFFRSKRHILLLATSIVGSILLRRNGKHVLYPAIAVIFLYLFSHWRKSGMDAKERRQILSVAAAVLLIPVLLAEVFSASIISYLKAEPGNSIRESLSFPVQQTARYFKEWGGEVTEEEKAAISTFLDYENLAEEYDPMLSDPVKGSIKEEATAEGLRSYLLVWLRQFTKHPLVYFKATVNQNYQMLYPYIPIYTLYVNRIDEDHYGEAGEKVQELLELSDVEPIASLKPYLMYFYTMCFYIPGLNMLSHIAFYMTLLIWLTLFALCKKRFLWLLASIPLWLSAVVVVLSPGVQSNPRYAFPIIYAMPIMLAYYIYLGRFKEPINL